MKNNHQEVDVLFEDNHFLVLNKPAGTVTQVSLDHKKSLESQARSYLEEKCNKTVYLACAHRLDKDVSGCVLFCKSSKALKRFNALQKKRQVAKIYFASVEGSMPSDNGVLKHYLVKKSFRSLCFDSSMPNAKEAILRYSVLSYKNGISHLRIQLITGRYHQIRSQLSHIGNPILGDRKYGAKTQHERLALHHQGMMFTYPINRQAAREA